MTFYELNNILITLTANKRKITREILTHIAQMYKIDGHKKLGYSSIIDYLRKGLGYSDDAAYRRWKAAKLLLQIPELGEKIASGNLNLTQSAHLQKAVETVKKEENRVVPLTEQKDLLNLIANKNNFDTQKIIAEKLEIKPKLIDQVKPQSDNTVRLEMQLTSKQYEKFLKVKSLLSHQVPDQKNADVLEVLFDLYLKKKFGKQNNEKPNIEIQEELEHKTENTLQGFMPARFQAEHNLNYQTNNHPKHSSDLINKDKSIANKFNTTTSKTYRSIKSIKSRYIPAKIKRQIFNRAKGKCENVDFKSGIECGSSYKLQIDHCKPLAHGGQTEIGNLRLLCSTCNAMAARNLGLGYETTSYFRKT